MKKVLIIENEFELDIDVKYFCREKFNFNISDREIKEDNDKYVTFLGCMYWAESQGIPAQMRICDTIVFKSNIADSGKFESLGNIILKDPECKIKEVYCIHSEDSFEDFLHTAYNFNQKDGAVDRKLLNKVIKKIKVYSVTTPAPEYDYVCELINKVNSKEL